MGAHRRRPVLRLYQPPAPDRSWPSAGFLAVVLLALAAFVGGSAWLADRLDRDARRRQDEQDLRRLDEQERRLKAQLRRLGP